MNVRPLHRSAAERFSGIPASPGSATERPYLRKVTDTVSVSQRARAALDEMRSRPEVEHDLVEKLSSQSLSERRSYEVAVRIAAGYYREPHVLRHVAAQVSGAISYVS